MLEVRPRRAFVPNLTAAGFRRTSWTPRPRSFFREGVIMLSLEHSRPERIRRHRVRAPPYSVSSTSSPSSWLRAHMDGLPTRATSRRSRSLMYRRPKGPFSSCSSRWGGRSCWISLLPDAAPNAIAATVSTSREGDTCLKQLAHRVAPPDRGDRRPNAHPSLGPDLAGPFGVPLPRRSPTRAAVGAAGRAVTEDLQLSTLGFVRLLCVYRIILAHYEIAVLGGIKD